MDITAKNAFIILKKYLENTNKNKFEHSIRVAQVCKVLAQKWNVPIQDAIVVGFLHDIGKSLNKREMLSLCVRNGITIYDFELFETLSALHGKVSSILFENEFNTDNPERFHRISHAISAHVAGDETMSSLDKIIFIADNIEPAKGNNILYKIQSGEIKDLDECVKIIIMDKKERANKENRELNPLLNLTLSSIEDAER